MRCAWPESQRLSARQVAEPRRPLEELANLDSRGARPGLRLGRQAPPCGLPISPRSGRVLMSLCWISLCWTTSSIPTRATLRRPVKK